MADNGQYATANKLWDFILGKGNAISQLPEELPQGMEQLDRLGSSISDLQNLSPSFFSNAASQGSPVFDLLKTIVERQQSQPEDPRSFLELLGQGAKEGILSAPIAGGFSLGGIDATGEALANLPENTGRAMDVLKSFFSEALPRTRAALGESPEVAQEVAGPASEVAPVGRTLTPEDIMRMVNSGETISLGADDSVESKRFTKSSGPSDRIKKANEDAQAEILKIQMREAKAPLMAKLRSGKITTEESGMLAEIIKREDDFLNQDRRKDRDLLSVVANTIAGRPAEIPQKDSSGRTVQAPLDPQVIAALKILENAGIQGIEKLFNQGG